MTRPPASVVVEALGHTYPGAERPALQDVGLTVEPGERLGLLGPNGAGKSTLMRLLCGFLPVDSGPRTKLEVAGLDVRTHSRAVRSRIGYMPEHVPLYAELRAREHLLFRARIKRVARRARGAEVERVADLTGIRHVLDAPISTLSRGYRQRVGIADALLGAPPLLILDEPTVGLDPNQVRDVRAMLRALGGAQTLVFSSHILAEVEMLCDRVVILSGGRVVADESIAEATRGDVRVGLLGEAEAMARLLREAEVGARVDVDAAERPGASPDDADPVARLRVDVGERGVAQVQAAIGRVAAQAGVTIVELAAGTTRLEERFADVTGARLVAESPAPDPDAAGEDAAVSTSTGDAAP